MRNSKSPRYGILLLFLINALGAYAPEPKLPVEPRNQDIVMPISPYFTDHIKQEEIVIRSIGIDFDNLHEAVTRKCPIGSPDDPPEIFNSSASYLGDIVKAGQVKFRRSLDIMAQDNAEGKAELEKYSFESFKMATTVFKQLDNTIASMPSLVETFELIKEMILRQGGWRYPTGTPRQTNLQNLAYDIYSAQVDLEQDLIKIPADRKYEFLRKWGDAHDKIAKYVLWAKNMRSWAYTYLNSDVSKVLLSDWKDPGRIGSGNTFVQPELSYQLVFLRYSQWAACWQNPLMRIIGWAINTMGPLPYPGAPKFYQRTTMSETELKEEVKKAEENRKALEQRTATLEAEHARLLAEKTRMLELLKERDNLAAEAERLKVELLTQTRESVPIYPTPVNAQGSKVQPRGGRGGKMRKKLVPPRTELTNGENSQNGRPPTPGSWSWWRSLLKPRDPNQDNLPQNPPQ
ncbi:hypothetical protein TWF694_006819 [Orbilia ellipsospora]|uniref:Uncharacterized protein n=1 Tax=Orbilia ellipsospora TaxID=2528407 RepID=A0AAV9XM87_9PEZI